MAHSPAGRRARRTANGPTPEQWLELPGWRRPVDTLLVLAVTFATAWVGLVVIPAATNSRPPTVTDRADSAPATSTSAHRTTDPGAWFAGPVYTGGPAAPTTEQPIATPAAVVAAPRAPVTRVVPQRTTPRVAPRPTTRAPAPRTTVAAAVATATSTQVPLAATTETTTKTTTPATTTPATTTSATTTSATEASPTTTTESTTASTTTSSSAPSAP